MNNKQITDFIELRAKGLSFSAIEKEIGVSKKTLIEKSKELSIDILNLRKIELEAIQEQAFLLKKQRIENFGKMMNQLRNELEKRDISEIPTDKLIELYLKIYDKAIKELTDNLSLMKITTINDFDISATKEKWET